jgi:hypothetical protein
MPGATVIVGNVEPSQHGTDYLFGGLGAIWPRHRAP